MNTDIKFIYAGSALMVLGMLLGQNFMDVIYAGMILGNIGLVLGVVELWRQK